MGVAVENPNDKGVVSRDGGGHDKGRCRYRRGRTKVWKRLGGSPEGERLTRSGTCLNVSQQERISVMVVVDERFLFKQIINNEGKDGRLQQPGSQSCEHLAYAQ
ncbi:hypothetical protein V6N13_107114 [Hibiscus sabdariffa]|uniref:Uncharacterized protein n=1 Tax=Hibiscus sabdariffa TaxID=183260 RepID=A0ABR2F2W8_9ROSI